MLRSGTATWELGRYYFVFYYFSSKKERRKKKEEAVAVTMEDKDGEVISDSRLEATGALPVLFPWTAEKM